MNVADIKAQVAANEKGVQELRRVVAQYGWPTVSAYMRHVMDNAEESRAAGDRAASATGAFDYRMDNGKPLRVAISVDRADSQRGGRFHRHRASRTTAISTRRRR